MSIQEYNREAWNRQVRDGNPWTIPVTAEVVDAARRGEWGIVLTPSKHVPREWFPPLEGLDTLCLASGGGQQAPVLAAAGARVTVLDNSPAQLAQDRLVAERDSLEIALVEGDMADLSAFESESFGLVVHPVSNCFAPQLRPVWSEAFRVLRRGGVLLCGMANPIRYLFDDELAERTGELHVKHALPYSDVESLTEEERRRYTDAGDPLEFSHTLEEQIGGQLDAGFVLTGFFEDGYADASTDPLTRYTPSFLATRAVKPS